MEPDAPLVLEQRRRLWKKILRPMGIAASLLALAGIIAARAAFGPDNLPRRDRALANLRAGALLDGRTLEALMGEGERAGPYTALLLCPDDSCLSRWRVHEVARWLKTDAGSGSSVVVLLADAPRPKRFRERVASLLPRGTALFVSTRSAGELNAALGIPRDATPVPAATVLVDRGGRVRFLDVRDSALTWPSAQALAKAIED